jgi:group I intron endonuclease
MSRRPKLIGIYKITCCKSKKVYIGSSKDVFIRLNSHCIGLLKGNHHNSEMQNDFNKYGLFSFSFQVVALSFDPKTLKELEQSEINKIKVEKRYNKINAVKQLKK